jgi:translocation and assembly module TamB
LLALEKMEGEADMTVSLSDLSTFFDPAGTTDVKGSMAATVQAKGSLEQKIEINAAGTMPARTAQLFTREIINAEGEVAIQIHAIVDKEIQKSVVTGRVELVNIAMVIDQTGQKLHAISGLILADRGKIQIQNLSGQLDTGSFTLSGDMGIVDFSPDRFTFRLKGRDLPVVVPDRMTALFQTDLVLNGTLKESSLGGAITLSSGEWTADFNLEKTALERILKPGQKRSTPSDDRSDTLLDTIELDLIVRADAPFSISNNLADLWVTPNLKIGGTMGSPAVTGRATLVPGTITYNGKEFELTTGIVDFIDPYGIAPVLDILAEHQIQDRQILLKLTGPPDNLILALSSVPEEQHTDILSLLLTGKTANELIHSEGGTTTSPASLVAGLAATSLADRLKKNVGIDTFEVGVGQSSSSSSLSDVNLTLGKEITDKITVTYGMETKEGEMIQKTSTDYKLSDRFTLSGFQNTEGHYGAEIRYRLEFQ